MTQTLILGKRQVLGLASGCIAIAVAPCFAAAQGDSDKVKAAMAALQAKTGKLGSPKIEGADTVAGKDVPVLHFGSVKMNNSFDIVDEVVKEHGGTATLFVKAGDDYVRVATNVKNDDGSRAIGTVLNPHGPVIVLIRKGEAYYGDTTILGKPYITGYEPIRDSSGGVVGIYYVGYVKG